MHRNKVLLLFRLAHLKKCCARRPHSIPGCGIRRPGNGRVFFLLPGERNGSPGKAEVQAKYTMKKNLRDEGALSV